MPIQIAVLADYSDDFEPHVRTKEALDHLRQAGVEFTYKWIDTDALPSVNALGGFDGLLVGGGSPYRDLDSVLQALRYARENKLPALGTCAGYTHMSLEYARNILGVDAVSSQYDRSGTTVVDLLQCSLRGLKLPIRLEANSKAAAAYGCSTAEECYYCRYGINKEYQSQLSEAGLHISGVDTNDGSPRVVELLEHPFYVGTAFVPQARSSRGQPHPLIAALVRAAAQRRA